MTALVEARDLGRDYPGSPPVRALAGFSLTVRPGEMIAVMGPSGSGKSTLLQLLGGLDSPTSGSVVAAGVELTGASRTQRAAIRRRHVGYVFQDLNLIPSLSAVENVALPLELDGTGRESARRSATEALESVGIQDLADRVPTELSGGQQQRVAIARALVGPRRLLLADEPTGALDSTTSREVLEVLRARVDAGAGAVVVTHDAAAAGWADRIVLIRDGRQVDALEPEGAADLLDGAR